MVSTGTRLVGAAAAAALALTLTAHVRAGRLAQNQEIRVETRSTTGPIGIAGPSGSFDTTPMTPGTGLIFGQAVDAQTSRPVAGTLVSLTLPGVRPIRVLTDNEGRFAF